MKSIIDIIKRVRQEEWPNAKNHYIHIGKHGNIARMINPKQRNGPVACSYFPAKPGEPIKKALNDEERKEANIRTRNAWMSDPPGKKNCHFLDIIEDRVGPHNITINADKVSDADAQWRYLEQMLDGKILIMKLPLESVLHIKDYQNYSKR